MFQEQLCELYEYSCWAWDQVMASLAQIPDEEYRLERPVFWGSLHGLVVHGWAAENIWLKRLNGESPQWLAGGLNFADLAAVQTAWEPLRTDWRAYLAGLDEATLFGRLTYRATESTKYSVRVHGLLHHVLNHATEHRSQMTPLLAQLGAPTVALDYLYWQSSQEL